ncbi:MAG: cytochrome P450 [Verrucomicrobiota bacterium]|nr:cytochrome P450 [Verrucomicrobiota bacterium]
MSSREERLEQLRAERFAQSRKPISGAAAAQEYLRLLWDPVGRMRELQRRHGNIIALGPVAFGAPGKTHVLAIGPDYNRLALSDPANFRPTGLLLRGPKNSAQRRVRYGLTRMTGAEHKQQRAMVAPPFHRGAVMGYHEIMVRVVGATIAQWQPGTRVDIYQEIRKLTLRIASSILFSNDSDEAYPIGRMLEHWMVQSFAPSVLAFPLDLPGTAYHGMLRNAEEIERHILAMIARRRAAPDARADVLSLLMETRDADGVGMTDAELVGQIAILFVASFETTTSALTWTLFLLAQHPEIANALLDEIQSALSDAPPSADALMHLELLGHVVKESMRILPPVPYTVRATQDEFFFGPYYVLHGARIVLSHYLTHHLPDLYPEPEKFRPARWQTINPNQYEYMPFSAGPRVCIGAAFATQVLKISIAMILQRFRFTVVPGTRIDRVVRITMNPRGGLPMQLEKQDRKFSRSSVIGQIREMVQ